MTEILRLQKENNNLLQENNKLLQKMRRQAVFGFWWRVITFLVLLVLPFALYFYYLKPYIDSAPDDLSSVIERIESMGDNFIKLEEFTKGLKERQLEGDVNMTESYNSGAN